MNRKNLFCTLSLLGTVVLLSPGAGAQSEQSAPNQQSQAQDEQAQPAAEAAESKSRSRPAQSFTPSEKIRADTSVAFPADI